MNFTAIDFETAQGYRHSICQIGLVRVENGNFIHTFECLVKPPGNFYWKWLTDEVHGITPEMTRDALTFDKVWHEIEPYIKGQNVVAHNIGFDAGCLKTTLEHYNLPVPEFTRFCTMQLFGGRLEENCNKYEIELNPHNALSDAMACAELFLIWLKKQRKYNM